MWSGQLWLTPITAASRKIVFHKWTGRFIIGQSRASPILRLEVHFPKLRNRCEDPRKWPTGQMRAFSSSRVRFWREQVHPMLSVQAQCERQARRPPFSAGEFYDM
jgi:hypothetical protein